MSDQADQIILKMYSKGEDGGTFEWVSCESLTQYHMPHLLTTAPVLWCSTLLPAEGLRKTESTCIDYSYQY